MAYYIKFRHPNKIKPLFTMLPVTDLKEVRYEESTKYFSLLSAK
ncbi:hypothetical protein NT6N_05240 [Oceaniferula spumae]|uniref:Uncharacterized protein n=1 Tax=Oceaniferula spumae TaxID=2979115 RepID=A0AAT9FHQ6_9BACT